MRAYLAYITHFVFLHPFLRRPQVLSTFIRHLTFIKSNLTKQKKDKKKNWLLFRIKFKQFHTFSAYSKFQFVFTLYVHFPL